ncbi:hypothetical protein BDN72DRAFT_789920 [Pluteus cervinus]|uniref:Uncharacterized protein n=1 Tax=Pluteus cervinus TaxID=181527 RepID=A0ACD3BAE3_9AGAR|nr:hypothetical protein BDN72DRAFT_789920 [Pluteus cervinus]
MVVAVGFWSIELIPGKEESFLPPADVRITNAALGDVLKDASGRTTVKLTYQKPPAVEESDDEGEEASPVDATTVLCSLTPGKIEQATVDLILESEEFYKFKLVGKNSVFLTGNYIDQVPVDNPPFGDGDSDMDSEADYGLNDMDLDIGMDGHDIESDASRFEEVIQEETTQTRKRLRDEASEVSGKDEKGKGKSHKKQKVQDGKPVVPADGEEADQKPVEKKKDKKDKKKKETDDSKKDNGTERELSGGLKIFDSKVGAGPAAKKGSSVSMRYIGKLENGKVFDKNTKGKPFRFRLGKQEVIKGWDEGIIGMQVGGERKLTVPAAMAYGDKGTDGIPPRSTLIFEVKLLELK